MTDETPPLPIDLPGWTPEALNSLAAYCDERGVNPLKVVDGFAPSPSAPDWMAGKVSHQYIIVLPDGRIIVTRQERRG